MQESVLQNKSVRQFILFSAVIFTAIFTIENINHRFWLNDFKVFYLAAKAMFSNQQVYGIPFGLDTGFYKYSPFTLLFFAPFTFLPYESAAIVYFFIDTACIITTIILLHSIISKSIFKDKKISFLILFLTLLCVINHLVRELHLGNTNMILILLLTLSLKYSIESKHKQAGLLLAIVILTKPYFLICILPLLLVKNYRTIMYMAMSLMLCVLFTMLITGFSRGGLLFQEWLTAMKEHTTYLVSQHTVFSLLNYYTGFAISPAYGIYFLGITGIVLLGYFWIKEGATINSNSIVNPKSQLIFFYVLISLVPTMLITDTEHFLFSLPLIIILILYLSNEKKYLWIVLFVLLMFMYGGNSSDLVGKKFAGKFEEWGLLGISNLVIIASVIYLYNRNKLRQIET